MINIKNFKNGKCKIKLSGELNIYDVAELKDELLPHIETPGEMSINLSEVSELDTSCFQMLVQLKKLRTDKGLDLVLTGHSNAVLNVFDLYGMADYFGDPLVLSA